jgi:tetratricopeptide (TPR) repeat protein
MMISSQSIGVQIVATDNPLDAEGSYQAAQDFARSGKHDEAILAYSSAIDADPRHLKARLGRGLALQRLGQHLDAIADFDDVINNHRDWGGTWVAYYSRAGSRLALGQHAEVVEDCDEVIRRNPEYINAFHARGEAWKALGDYDAALSDMNVVLDADPNHPQAYLVRGQIHYDHERWAEAFGDLTQAIEGFGEHSEQTRQCYYLRGLVAHELGDFRVAIDDFSRAIELRPNDPGAYLRRAYAYRELGDDVRADADFQAGSELLLKR